MIVTFVYLSQFTGNLSVTTLLLYYCRAVCFTGVYQVQMSCEEDLDGFPGPVGSE